MPAALVRGDVDMSSPLHVGIDIGSKTVKLVMQDDAGRHRLRQLRSPSLEREGDRALRAEVRRALPPRRRVLRQGSRARRACVSPEILDVPFTQEVVACRSARSAGCFRMPTSPSR